MCGYLKYTRAAGVFPCPVLLNLHISFECNWDGSPFEAGNSPASVVQLENV